MTDLVITVAQVLPGAATDTVPPSFVEGIAGATITAGQAVYLDATALTIKLADANATVATAAAIGIATHGALAGQPIRVQTRGDITLGAGAAPAVGVLYVASNNAGGLAPSSDLGATQWATVLGVGIGSNKVRLQPWATGQATA